MLSIPKNIEAVYARIERAKLQYRRSLEDIRLIAVSKQQSSEAIAVAYASGQHHFGENYVQEAHQKIETLSSSTMVWHFIGAIQSNKITTIATHFDWIHSVSSLKIAQKLSAQRNKKIPLNICIQVQRDADSAGIALSAVPELAHKILLLPHLQLRGLMMLGPISNDFNTQCAAFAPLQQLFLTLKSIGPQWDTLSIGMSNDLEAAICMGSTCLRIGSAIFGARHGPTN